MAFGCSKCSSYSRGLGRCERGMIFPKTIKGAVEAAKWMGFAYLCSKSPASQKAIAKILAERKNG